MASAGESFCHIRHPRITPASVATIVVGLLASGFLKVYFAARPRIVIDRDSHLASALGSPAATSARAPAPRRLHQEVRLIGLPCLTLAEQHALPSKAKLIPYVHH